jgi:biotin carboxyl carrier protein
MKTFKFTINGNTYDINVKDFQGNFVEVEVNGTPYKVELHKEIKTPKTPTLVRSTVPVQPGQNLVMKSGLGGAFVVKSPLPGTVLKVLVKVGDKVAKGDKLLIMEAMKMENNVLAERDGIVKSILINPGQTVLQNDVLIEIG